MLENSTMCRTLSPSQPLEVVASSARPQPRRSCTSAVTSPNAAFLLASSTYLLKRPIYLYFCSSLYCIHHIILSGSSSPFNSSPMTGFTSTIPYASPSLHTLSPISRYANPSWIDFVLKSTNNWKPLLFRANSILISCLASPEQVLLLSQDSFLVPTLSVDRSDIRHLLLSYLCRQLEVPSFPNRAEPRRQRSSREPRLLTTASDIFANRVYPPQTVFASKLVAHDSLDREIRVTFPGFLVDPIIPYLSQLHNLGPTNPGLLIIRSSSLSIFLTPERIRH